MRLQHYLLDRFDGGERPKEHRIVRFLQVVVTVGGAALKGAHLCSSEWPSVKLGGSPPRRALNPQKCE